MSPWYPVGWSALGDGRRHGAGATGLLTLVCSSTLGTPLELIVGIRYAYAVFCGVCGPGLVLVALVEQGDVVVTTGTT
jgi:shikimate kinase